MDIAERVRGTGQLMEVEEQVRMCGVTDWGVRERGRFSLTEGMKSGVFGTIEGKDEKVSVGQEVMQRMNWISLMKQQFFITHTVRQNEILDSSNSVSAS